MRDIRPIFGVAATLVVTGLAAVSANGQIVPITPLRVDQVRPCSVATLSGTYGFFRSGTITQGPLAAVGTGEYDGRGFFTIRQTTSRNGTFSEGGFDGPYEVNADCTGRWLTPDRQGMVGYFVIVDSGNEFYFLSTSPGNTVSGIAKRIRRVGP